MPYRTKIECVNVIIWGYEVVFLLVGLKLSVLATYFDQPMTFGVTVVVVGIVWGKDCAIFSSQSSPAILNVKRIK